MRIIDLDASSWTEPLDFYRTLLPAIGAPEWHSKSIDALLDTMIWNREINELRPSYRIVVHGTAHLPDEVKNRIVLTRDYLAVDRQEHIDQYGEDVDVSMDILS